MRNSITPNIHFQVRHHWKDHVAENMGILSVIVPLLVTSKDIETDVAINSGNGRDFSITF